LPHFEAAVTTAISIYYAKNKCFQTLQLYS
jgi:hypothetical protein